jgi:glycine/D-amino acid oxidase-like deaminating enzyme
MSERELGSADVAIIGGGLVGCATAYYLAAGGVNVALLERTEVNREASGTNAGSLHLQIYIHPTFGPDWIDNILPSVALLREAAKSWASLESVLGADCGIRLGGGLWVSDEEEHMGLIEAKVRAENSMGVDSVVLSRHDMLQVAPYLATDIVGGSYLPGEGFADPLLVTPAFAHAAVARGARIITQAPVQSIEPRPGGGFKLGTARGSFEAGQVVTAAGAWTPEVARMVGLALPITGGVAHVNVTEPRPPIMLDHMLQHISKGLTMKQSPQGTFIIGGGWPGRYDRTTKRNVTLLDTIVGNVWVAAKTVPALRDAQVVRTWGGMGSGTPNGMPIIGASERVKGFHVAYAPLGFTMGPIVGQMFSEDFLTGDSTVPLAPFSPNRF